MQLLEQLANMKSELVTLQTLSADYHSITVENTDLKDIVDSQQKKLNDYEVEVSKTKEHMQRLENIIQRIQEEKLAPSVSS